MVLKELVKSKKEGERPVDEMNRILEIRNQIFEHINSIYTQEFDTIYFSIEGLAFLAKGTSLVQLSALNYMVREWIIYDDNQFVIIAPSSLKKYIT